MTPGVRNTVYLIGFVAGVYLGSLILPEEIVFGTLLLIFVGMIFFRWNELSSLLREEGV